MEFKEPKVPQKNSIDSPEKDKDIKIPDLEAEIYKLRTKNADLIVDLEMAYKVFIESSKELTKLIEELEYTRKFFKHDDELESGASDFSSKGKLEYDKEKWENIRKKYEEKLNDLKEELKNRNRLDK